METITLHVEGMMCAHCQARVEKAVAGTGAAEVQVDLEKKSVTCALSGGATEAQIKAAITEAGYEVR